MEATERIYGKDIFFHFKEFEWANRDTLGNLIHQIKNKELDGFIMKNVFTAEEIKATTDFLSNMDESEFMPTPSGKIFPAPFATITNTEERLDGYFFSLEKLHHHSAENKTVNTLLTRLHDFFYKVGKDYQVSIPVNKIKNKAVSPGTFRLFYPNMGGLHVHCGNLFQAQSMFYYSLIKNDIDMNDQLSYFIVLQQSEAGGELTIYDMLWDQVKQKKSPENNDFVIADTGEHIYVNTLKSFAVKPKAGDILVFSGGPIWHRVEDIKGTSPRITFGGFLNFSNDNKEVFYWS